jgi:hypothetical protein
MYTILVGSYSLKVRISPGVVHLALRILILLRAHLVPVHHRVVLIAALIDLISKLAVLVGDSDLFLQPLFFVVQLAETVFEHLCLFILSKC